MHSLTLVEIAVIVTGSFVSVFLLGLQSKNVNQGRYLAAIITSAGISLSQFVFVKFAASGNLEALAYSMLGGCSGIASSIWFYQSFMHRKSPDLSNPFPKIELMRS